MLRISLATVLTLLLAVHANAFQPRYPVPVVDYQQDAAAVAGNYGQQQVFLPEQLAAIPPFSFAKRRGGGVPLRTTGSGSSQLDVATRVRQLNTSHRADDHWPDVGIKFGAVAGVSLDSRGNVVIFHRADRVWSENTFDWNNVFQERRRLAIPTNTIIGIDRRTGEKTFAFGRDLFYMPHGITVDHEDNVWVTDVALHQVMKLNREVAGDHPLMVLGRKFTPGNTKDTFCKPTSVAVLPNGDFFVADGYCNARIIKYNKVGERILSWGENSLGRNLSPVPVSYFGIPHGLTLALDKGLLCVADRENGRVQCFHHSNGTFHSQYQSPLIGDRLFSVAYAPVNGGQLYVVNGPPLNPSVQLDVKGFVINMASGNVTAKFPDEANYSNPHDIAVTADAAEIYVVEYDPYRVHKLVSLERIATRGVSSVVVPVPQAGVSALHSVLIVALVVLLGVVISGVLWFVVHQKKRGMPGGDDDEDGDDVEYRSLVQKSSGDH